MNWLRHGVYSLFWIGLILSVFLFSANPAQTAEALKDCTNTSVGFKPLIDMQATDYYPNAEHPDKVNGGLYGDGRNTPPQSHWQKAKAVNAAITPRLADGTPAADGKIGLIALGMSNTSSEFYTFQTLIKDSPLKAPAVIAVNGAQASMTAYWWAYPTESRDPWINFNQQIQNAGLTASQIQVVWMKLTEMGPQPGADDYPVFAYRLRDEMAVIARRLKQDYPNVQIVYLSSRIYAGYSLSPQSPEPFAYEGGFSNRWLIEDQINGGPLTGVTYANAPVLLWGPYLWADGLTPNSEGLTWECTDYTDDAVHPSQSGNLKVSQKLLTFFSTDPLAGQWFSLLPAPPETILLMPMLRDAPATGKSPSPKGTLSWIDN